MIASADTGANFSLGTPALMTRTAQRTAPRRTPLPAWTAGLATVFVGALGAIYTAAANPVVGFTENWTGASLDGWAGGAVLANPGTGGVSGAGDGFFRFSTPNGLMHNLGTVSFGLEYQGNWIAAGVTQVWLWLNDVDADDPLEIHFAIGNGSNFWYYNVGFLPPHNEWAGFVVDLSSPTNWTQTIGTGTFTQALQNVDRIHIRHDKAPYVQMPDPIDADVGLDHLLLTNGIVGVPPRGPAVAQPVRLAPPVPNPSHGPVALSLEVYDGRPVRLEIIDAAGRRVRGAELAGGRGHRIWTWDARDDGGRQVPPGAYRVRAIGAAGGMSRPLIRMR